MEEQKEIGKTNNLGDLEKKATNAEVMMMSVGEWLKCMSKTMGLTGDKKT